MYLILHMKQINININLDSNIVLNMQQPIETLPQGLMRNTEVSFFITGLNYIKLNGLLNIVYL